MPKTLFTHIFDGLEFTFEKRPCRKDAWGYHTPACNRPQLKGSSNMDRAKSQTVTLCNHLIPNFDPQAWKKSEQSHIDWILKDAQEKLDREQLDLDAHPRSGDRVWETFNDDAPWLNRDPALRFGVTVKGLTRAEAIRLYAMADAIKGERD